MPDVHDLFSSGGHVGALMRAHDWSTSPLGPPDRWPQSLRSVVDLRAARHWDLVAQALSARLPGAIARGLVLDFGDAPGLRVRAPRWWQRWA
jgi:hypothetical protein